MDYERALEIGRVRRKEAAQILRRWAGVRTCEVCAVRPRVRVKNGCAGGWEPVGEENYKDVMRKGGALTQADTYILVVDGDGNVKACSWEPLPLRKAVELANQLALPVPKGRRSELERYLEEADMRETVMGSTLHQEF
jgi:hypothetical protein